MSQEEGPILKEFKRALFKRTYIKIPLNKHIFSVYYPINILHDGKSTCVLNCHTGGAERFAIKIYKIDSGLLETGETKPELLKRYEQICFTNIISVKFIQIGNENVIISPYKGENLRQYRQGKGETISMDLICNILVQCLKILKVLHEYKLIHRDIKEDNIFIENDLLVIGDLGCVKYVQEDYEDVKIDLNSLLHDTTTGEIGTRGYIAPEIFNYQRVSPKSDIWSLGVTILKFIFPNSKKLQETSNNHPSEVYKMVDELFEGTEIIEIKEILKSMLENDINKRVSALECLQIVEQSSHSVAEISDFLKKEKLMRLRKERFTGDALGCILSDVISDTQFLWNVVIFNGLVLEHASEDLKNNKHFVLVAVTQNGLALKYASNRLRNDREVVLQAIIQNQSSFQYSSDQLRGDKDFILKTIVPYLHILEFILPELKNDRGFILRLVIMNGFSLEYASDDLANDREIVLQSVKQNGLALEFASFKLQYDREIVLQAVKTNGFSLQFVPINLQSDKQIVSEAVKQEGFSLQYASTELRNDKEIVLQAVNADGLALKYASTDLQNNHEIALQATENNENALEYASINLQSDKKFISKCIDSNLSALKYAHYFNNDKEFVLDIIKMNGFALIFISGDLTNDREIVLQSVKQNGLVLEYVSMDFRNDKEIVLQAVKENGLALEFASNNFQCVSKDDLKNDREIVLESVKQNGLALRFASEYLLSDKEVVLEAVKNNGYALNYAAEYLKEAFQNGNYDWRMNQISHTMSIRESDL